MRILNETATSIPITYALRFSARFFPFNQKKILVTFLWKKSRHSLFYSCHSIDALGEQCFKIRRIDEWVEQKVHQMDQNHNTIRWHFPHGSQLLDATAKYAFRGSESFNMMTASKIYAEWNHSKQMAMPMPIRMLTFHWKFTKVLFLSSS